MGIYRRLDQPEILAEETEGKIDKRAVLNSSGIAQKLVTDTKLCVTTRLCLVWGRDGFRVFCVSQDYYTPLDLVPNLPGNLITDSTFTSMLVVTVIGKVSPSGKLTTWHSGWSLVSLVSFKCKSVSKA